MTARQGLIGIGANGAEGRELLRIEEPFVGFGALVVEPDAERMALGGWEVAVLGLEVGEGAEGFPPFLVVWLSCQGIPFTSRCVERIG